ILAGIDDFRAVRVAHDDVWVWRMLLCAGGEIDRIGGGGAVAVNGNRVGGYDVLRPGGNCLWRPIGHVQRQVKNQPAVNDLIVLEVERLLSGGLASSMSWNAIVCPWCVRT